MNILELRVGGFYKSNGYEKALFVDPENKTNTGWLNADEPFVLLSKPIDAQNSEWKDSIGYFQRKRMWMKILTSGGIVGWGIWYTNAAAFANAELEELTTGEKT